ncbi:MAG: hypothetical protein Q7T16_03790 [Candidatus Burarchaeum sp.]|nr:hypothetical protein [Candidatus Burarchaeum sp.]MDO8339754.1 hypothetical protein [Candidatus Burarchaeum sp.]
MVSSGLRPATVLLVVIAIIVLALFANSYAVLTQDQQLALTYLIKIILAVLAVAFLAFFQLRWVATKYDLSVLHFYIKWKFFRQSLPAGAGVLLLAMAFILDFGRYANVLKDPNLPLVINLLEMLALTFFGYTYYRLARLQGV